MDGVLAEDARTSKTLFGGSARVFKEGGHTQDVVSIPRRLTVNARMKFVIPTSRYLAQQKGPQGQVAAGISKGRSGEGEHPGRKGPRVQWWLLHVDELYPKL